MVFQLTTKSAFIVACAFGLTACVDNTNSSSSEPSAQKQNPSLSSSGKEVPAPEIFSLSDRAVWDGRPTLGGVWVAHENSRIPTRATITNTANGKSTTGALWSKSKGIPGPAFTISSDMANALGMKAGVPVTIKVVALTKEVVQAPPTPEAEPAEATSEPTKSAETEPSAEEVEEKPKRGFRLFGKRKDTPETPEVATTEIEEAPEVKPEPTPTAAGGRFAQIGLFSEEANANAALKSLQSKGLGGKIVVGKSKAGKSFWRVLAGPASGTAAETKLISDVKALGFKDAFLVKG